MASDDLDSNYKAAGFGSPLKPGARPCLLLVDFVLAYFDKGSPLYAGVEDALASAVRVLAAARRAEVPVVFTQVMYSKGGQDGGIFYRKVPALRLMESGNPMGAIMPPLDPQPHDILIQKQYPSAFFGTSLASALTSKGIDTVLIGGLTTSGCVRASCVDAMSYGFIPLVVRDACGDRHEGPHKANLFDMEAKYAELVSEQQAIHYLAQSKPSIVKAS